MNSTQPTSRRPHPQSNITFEVIDSTGRSAQGTLRRFEVDRVWSWIGQAIVEGGLDWEDDGATLYVDDAGDISTLSDLLRIVPIGGLSHRTACHIHAVCEGLARTLDLGEPAHLGGATAKVGSPSAPRRHGLPLGHKDDGRRELSAEETEDYGLDPTGRSGLTAWGPAELIELIELDDGTTVVGVVVDRP